MASDRLVARLKGLGNTPVCIGAQKALKTGKGGLVTKWITTPVTMVPASEALSTIKAIIDLGVYPLYNIVVMLDGGDAYHGRPVVWYDNTKQAVEAVKAARAEETKADLEKANNKLTDAQAAAFKAAAIAEYLKSQGKAV